MDQLRRLPFLAAALLLAGCGRVWLPVSVEQKAGREAAAAIRVKAPRYPDEAWQDYVAGLGKRLAAVSERPAAAYSFEVLVSSDVNAFSTPDGSVFVTTGLMKLVQGDERALEGVLGHEIGHIARRHGGETMQTRMGVQFLVLAVFGFDESAGKGAAQLGGEVAALGYGRDMEIEADLCSLRYMRRLGRSPEESLRFLERLLAVESAEAGSLERYFHSHPPTAERLQAAKDYLGKVKKPA